MIKKAQQASRAQKQQRSAAGRARLLQAARKMRATRRAHEPLPPVLPDQAMPTELVEPERFLQARLIFDQRLNNYAYTAPELGSLLGSPDFARVLLRAKSTDVAVEHAHPFSGSPKARQEKFLADNFLLSICHFSMRRGVLPCAA
jgi:hypothetical protein